LMRTECGEGEGDQNSGYMLKSIRAHRCSPRLGNLQHAEKNHKLGLVQ
jgi:hypothetical protein